MRNGRINTITNVPPAAEHRMYATLLAQPVRWVRSIVARCAFRRTAPDGSQQRRVMPPFGGCPDGLVPIPFSAGGGAPQRPMRIDHAPLVRNGRICMITNLAPAAEHRMYATLLAQPQPGRDLSSPVCAISRTTSNACQQRRVMPPFGGSDDTWCLDGIIGTPDAPLSSFDAKGTNA